MTGISKVIDSTQMSILFWKGTLKHLGDLKKFYLAVICDLENLKSGKCISEEGGRTSASINKHINMAEKVSCYIFLITS